MANANKTIETAAALELDINDNIIGGEWKNNLHPNFMWKLDENFPVKGCCDDDTSEFNGKVNEEFKNSVVTASSKAQVIKSVVTHLAKESARNITVSFQEEFHNRWDFLFNS